MSREFMATMRDIAHASNVPLAESAARRSCAHCSAVLIPVCLGQKPLARCSADRAHETHGRCAKKLMQHFWQGLNCTMKLASRRQRPGRRGAPAPGVHKMLRGRESGPKKKKAIDRKTLVMRNFCDGFKEGKHSSQKNELRCKCNTCGSTVLLGG